jgi:hypothetical protein
MVKERNRNGKRERERERERKCRCQAVKLVEAVLILIQEWPMKCQIYDSQPMERRRVRVKGMRWVLKEIGRDHA